MRIPGRFRSSIALPVFLLCVLAGTASARAQHVTGVVLADDTERPVGGVAVRLADTTGVVVAEAVSDRRGAFHLIAPAAGTYVLTTDHISFRPSTTEALTLLDKTRLTVELRVGQAVLALDPLHVIARREIRPYLERKGFYAREDYYEHRMGGATFFDSEELEQTPVSRLTELLFAADGVRIEYLGATKAVVRTRRGAEMPLYINGVKIRLDGASVNDFLPMAMIGAVEVYSSISPAQYGGGPALVVWTKMW